MREKILDLGELKRQTKSLQQKGLRTVFTNGCFDLLHPGHVRYLQRARDLGDRLVVGINDDASVQRLKGPERPVQDCLSRCEIVAALSCVDFVTVFAQDTPFALIQELVPDVLVKGGDWPVSQIVGRDVVESAGGRVISLEFEKGFSTSEIISRIRSFRGVGAGPQPADPSS